MTLVLTYLDDNATVHVADRRLTRKVNGVYELVTDDAVKVDIMRGSLLVSYSGRSVVQGLAAPRWIETRLEQSAEEMRETFSSIAGRLTDLFRRDEYLGHFLIVTVSGWAINDDGAAAPIIGTLINQHPKTLARLDEFVGVATPMDQVVTSTTKSGWTWAGRLSDEGKAELNQRLPEALSQGANPAHIANVFADQIRVEAERDIDQTIGRSLRAAILPAVVMHAAVQTGCTSVGLLTSDNGEYLLGTPMKVDLPEGRRMEWFTPIGPAEPA